MTKSEAEKKIEALLAELEEKSQEVYSRCNTPGILDEGSEEITPLIKKYFVEIEKIKKEYFSQFNEESMEDE